MTELASQRLQRRRQGAIALGIAASLLVLFGLASAANLIGSDDDPAVVRDETEAPVPSAPAAPEADPRDDGVLDDRVLDEGGTASVPGAGEPTVAATSGPTVETVAAAVEPTPPPAAAATSASTPQPAAPTATAAPAPTATPPAGPSCTSPFELVGTQCLTYATPFTTAPTCLEPAVAAGDVCVQTVSFLPLENQCPGTVSDLTCITTVAKIVTQACPDGTISWPLGGDTSCGLQAPATQGAPSCPNGTAGVAGPTDGGCYLPLGPPNAAGECPDNGPAVTTSIVNGECRQPVANVPGSSECPVGAQPFGTDCLTPVAAVASSECPLGSTPSGDTCQVATQLTPQCPADASIAADGTCFRQSAPLPGELACVEGVLETDICVVTGPEPQ